jgi:hypothetical protein
MRITYVISFSVLYVLFFCVLYIFPIHSLSSPLTLCLMLYERLSFHIFIGAFVVYVYTQTSLGVHPTKLELIGSSLGSTAQIEPWPALLGFRNNKLFTGLDC